MQTHWLSCPSSFLLSSKVFFLPFDWSAVQAHKAKIDFDYIIFFVGVGKSSLAATLSMALAKLDKKVPVVLTLIAPTLNPLSLKIHIQILQTDLHTFLLRIVERIWFKIKAFFLW